MTALPLPLAGGAKDSPTDYTNVIHGSLTTYRKGCKCPDCTAVNTEAMRAYRHKFLRPDVVYLGAMVGPGSAKRQLHDLREAGLGVPEIAKRSGISENTVLRILNGAARKITTRTRDALLAVWPSDTAPGCWVDAGPVWEQVDALVALGWSRRQLGKLVHGPDATTVNLGRTWVTKRMAEKVAALYADEFPDAEAERDYDDPLELFHLLVEPGARAWRNNAACRSVTIPEPTNHPFFPGRGTPPVTALDVCSRCTVWADCLGFALATNEQGIWGRSTGQDRRDLKNRGLSVAQIAEVMPEGGTVANALRAIPKETA